VISGNEEPIPEPEDRKLEATQGGGKAMPVASDFSPSSEPGGGNCVLGEGGKGGGGGDLIM